MPASKKTPRKRGQGNHMLPDFEKSLAELERIVQRMEQGEQSLEQTLRDFERGMTLSDECQKSLDAAQQRVEKLVKKHGGHRLEAFAQEDDKDADDGDEDEYDDEDDESDDE
ncbi:MAG: exodeoxyribonuclease VII small subunit [bacterium]